MHEEIIRYLREMREHVVSFGTCYQHMSENVKKSLESILSNNVHSAESMFTSDIDGLCRSIHNSTDIFQSCIEDLLLMANAMHSIIDTNPNELPALMVNLYCTLTRQLTDYFAETSKQCTRYQRSIESNKAAVMKCIYDTALSSSTELQLSSSSSSKSTTSKMLSRKSEKKEEEEEQRQYKKINKTNNNNKNNNNDKSLIEREPKEMEESDFVLLPSTNKDTKHASNNASASGATNRDVMSEEKKVRPTNNDESGTDDTLLSEQILEYDDDHDSGNAHKHKRKKKKVKVTDIRHNDPGNHSDNHANVTTGQRSGGDNNNNNIKTHDEREVNVSSDGVNANTSSRLTKSLEQREHHHEDSDINDKEHSQHAINATSHETLVKPHPTRTQEDEIAALTAVAAVSALRQKTHELDHPILADRTQESNTLLRTTPLSAINNMRQEPPYLQISTSIHDALGHVVLASRPTVFTDLDVLMQMTPITMTYYLQLNRSGSLSSLVLSNYINPDEDAQADLLCEVLETDEVELGSFESIDGEISISTPHELPLLPWCGWRICNNEDHSNILYTIYLLAEQPAHSKERVLYLQDVCISHDHRDEVLHVIKLLPDMPQFVKVEVYTQTSSNSGNILSTSSNNNINSNTTNTSSSNLSFASRSKAMLILTFTRSTFIRSGCREVTETEIHTIRQHNRQTLTDSTTATSPLASSRSTTSSSSPSTAIGSHRVRVPPHHEIDAKEAFQPNVQLASLSEPASSGAGVGGFSFGDVAKGAVKGGLDLLMAPLNISKAVGGAVLDATGVTDAMKTSMEQTFYKAFPTLIYEQVVDTYNCAWSESSIPKQGVLFITSRWLCFQSSISSSQFAIEYDEIKDVKKAKSAKLFDNAINIVTHLNETYYLTNFLQRDQAYSLIMQQWVKQEKFHYLSR